MSSRSSELVKPPSSQNDFENLWRGALHQYTKQTGLDLERTPFAVDLLKCKSPGELFGILDSDNKKFEGFRNHGQKVRAVLNPIMSTVQVSFETAGQSALVSHILMMKSAAISDTAISPLCQQEVL